MSLIKSRQPIYNALPGDDRKTTEPILRQGSWELYLQGIKQFWHAGEIRAWEKDRLDFANKLSPELQHCVKLILGFFAAGDQFVNENIIESIRELFSVIEVRYFYDFQIMMENIHAQTYSMLIVNLINDSAERDAIFKAFESLECIRAMVEWLRSCRADITNGNVARGLLKQACVEGIFFTSCFCVIYWLGSRGWMPALCQSNNLIARDEDLHTRFGIHLITDYVNVKPTTAEYYEIVGEAVVIADKFAQDMLPRGVPEMTAELMSDYIRVVANCLLARAGIPALYPGVRQPFGFMEQINMKMRENFFEQPTTVYEQGSATATPIDYDSEF